MAPRTEVSASWFCGGSLPPASGGIETAIRNRCGPDKRGSAGRNDRFHVGGDAFVNLDRDHVRPGVPDRLLELDLAAVQLQPARLLDGFDDVLRRDGAEQAAVVAGGLRDRQDRA